MFKKIVVVMILSLWPLNLFLNNTLTDFSSYFLLFILTGTSLGLYLKKSKTYSIPLFVMGIISPKMVLLPVLIFIIDIILEYRHYKILPLAASLILLAIMFKPFVGQTIFNKDYEAEQLILRNTQLYPNVLLARTFQNKGKIYSNKIIDNFFVLTDPNNYFFALHPRPITLENQNLYKYPFPSVVFFVISLIAIKKYKHKKVFIFFIAEIVALSVLKNFDRFDFILHAPISLLLLHGINTAENENRKTFNTMVMLFLIFSVPEYIRSYVEKIF